MNENQVWQTGVRHEAYFISSAEGHEDPSAELLNYGFFGDKKLLESYEQPGRRRIHLGSHHSRERSGREYERTLRFARETKTCSIFLDEMI